MKKIILLAFLCFLLLSPAKKSQAAIDGHLNITYPNGGEVFTEGDIATIRWDASSNIDKVSIGYSTGPGSLNWIAFTAPNTGSYTWKVDVGNTTKTSFIIDITGYETGKGSLSDKSDGWFTVNQKSEYPAEPAPAPEPIITPVPTPEPESEPAPVVSTPAPTPAPTATPTPTPTPTATPAPTANVNVSIQNTTIISITQIEINEYYYFEGSKSTDLSKVDPAHVSNFTLDQMDLMYFTFIGETDLSSQEAIDTFENLDEMVYMDYYYVWFEWEFWILFETEVNCTFYDEADTLNADSPVTLNGQTITKEEYEVQALDSGEKKVKIKPEVIKKYVPEGEKIEIAMKPTLEVNITPGQEIQVSEEKFALSGKASSDSKVFVNFNGEKLELFVSEDGQFEKNLTLEQGKNNITVMAYEPGKNNPYATIESVIEFTPMATNDSKENNTPIIIVGFIIIIIAGLVFVVSRKKTS